MPSVKVVLNLGAEKRGKSAGFSRLGTNVTQLQLVRSCAFLLDPGADFKVSKCGNALGFPDSKNVCQSAELHRVF